MTGPTNPLSTEHDPIERADRERRAQAAVRRQRVERAGMVPCERCGGTSADVDDLSLSCECAARDAEFRSRVARTAFEHRVDLDGNRSDQIAP